MATNRSMPPGVMIPELGYADVSEAAAWLCRSFGFVERLRIGSHRIQLTFGDGSVVVTERPDTSGATPSAGPDHGVMVRVPDANKHYEHAKRFGAKITGTPTDYPFGERQYSAVDLGGHRWTFSQTIADADPSAWGGTLMK